MPFISEHNAPSTKTSSYSSDLKNSFAKVLSFQHANEALRSLIDPVSNVQLGLESTISKPILHLLLVILEVGRPEPGSTDKEALHGDLLGNELHQTLDSLLLILGGVIIADLFIVSNLE